MNMLTKFSPRNRTLAQAMSVAAAGSILVLAGCASLPPNPELEALQSRYEVMSGQPYASQEAQSELDETREAIELGRVAYAKDDDDALAHYIFVADKNLDIAAARIELNETRTRIASATETREGLLREAREREVARAEAERRAAEATARAAQNEANRNSVVISAQQQELALRQAELSAQERELALREAELAAAKEQVATLERQAQLLADQLVEVTMVVNERGTTLVLSDIMFDFDSAAIKPGSSHALDEIASFLNQQEVQSVKVEGHTDAVGTDEYNLGLSRDRADAVRIALIDRGVSPSTLSTFGYGEDYPVASNDSASGRQLNRRVELVLDDKVGRPISAR